MRYEHGTATAYSHDGCRCQDCKDARSAEDDRRKRLRAMGRWDGETISGDAVRAHVARLHRRGMTTNAIATQAGIAAPSLKAIIQGGNVRVRTQRRVLAVTATTHLYRADRTDATGTYRRLQALYCLGWNGKEIAKVAGISHQHISFVVRGELAEVTLSLAARVVTAYDRLAMRTPPRSRYATAAANRAAREGWAPPLAWDDIDDPQCRPVGVRREAA